MNRRIQALENSANEQRDNPAIQEFHSSLRETHNAGDVVRVAPYDKVTRLKLGLP